MQLRTRAAHLVASVAMVAILAVTAGGCSLTSRDNTASVATQTPTNEADLSADQGPDKGRRHFASGGGATQCQSHGTSESGAGGCHISAPGITLSDVTVTRISPPQYGATKCS